MKLKHFYVCICMVLANILSIHATVKNITLTEAGTLSVQIGRAHV